MGCAASSHHHGTSVVTPNNNNVDKVIGVRQNEFINPETGERELCDEKMILKQSKGSGATPFIKNNSLTIKDKSEQHARTGEEPAHPLPEADYGDMKLGITVCVLFFFKLILFVVPFPLWSHIAHVPICSSVVYTDLGLDYRTTRGAPLSEGVAVLSRGLIGCWVGEAVGQERQGV